MLNATHVEIMQTQQIDNVNDALLKLFGIYRLGGEDVSRYEAIKSSYFASNDGFPLTLLQVELDGLI